MKLLFSTRVIAIVFIAAALGVGLFALIITRNNKLPEPAPVEPVETKKNNTEQKTIGLSVEGRKLEAYTYGNGGTRLVFIGGIHGGYEWNSILLAYTFKDYLDANLEFIPRGLTVTVIPSANPDGVYKVIGKEGRFTLADIPTTTSTVPGRFNANDVDLNRNFDCRWQRESMWRGNKVSAGRAAFSEPEAVVLRDFILYIKPAAVIFWHSQANAVFASECGAGILPQTLDIMNAYSRASGYPAIKSFDAYAISGDAEGWLASIGIPAITVELKTHETIEWERNLAGIKALFEYYVSANDTLPVD